MQWVKRNSTLLAVLSFILIYLLVLVPELGTNELNPDSIEWHRRSEQFVRVFIDGDLTHTYQHYHPGVTLMWLMGPPIEALKRFTDLGRVYSSENYIQFHTVAKTILVLTNLTLSLILIWVLARLISFWKAFSVVSLMNLEPFFLGSSRLLHMDVMFTNLVALSLVVSYLALKSQKYLHVAFAALFAASAILTRSIALGLVFYIIAFFGYASVVLKNKKYLSFILIFIVCALITTTLLMPALFVDPIKYINEIFIRSYDVGITRGHSQIFLGKQTQDPGMLFYPLVTAIKLSPFMIIGVFSALAFGAVKLKKHHTQNYISNTLTFKNIFAFTLYLAIFYLGYFVLIQSSTKKLDRYILPIYFLFSYFAVYGYWLLFEHFSSKITKILVTVLFGVSVLIPIFTLKPFEFLYYSPLFGSSKKANSFVYQKNFGMGSYDLTQLLIHRYNCNGEKPAYSRNFKVKLYSTDYKCKTDERQDVGMRDVKAIAALYGSSNVVDYRIGGTSDYDVLVLAMGEELPEKVKKSGIAYSKDASVFVRDIELWRIYVKQN